MTNKTFTFTVSPPVVYGNTVIDQMVQKMTEFQQANGGRALYSFELPQDQAHWRFLGENHEGTERMNYKPAGMPEINDFISPWGEAVLAPNGRAGYRAFEGGPDSGNVTLLEAKGAGWRSFWDEQGDAMWHIAGSTGSDDVKQGLVKYDAARDVFLHWTSGGPADGSDSAASLWPGKGSAHNFGTSAWDATRRRLYKIMRTGIGAQPNPIRWWPCWADVAGETSYPSRTEWIAGRNSWINRVDEANYTTGAAWQECVFAPEFGNMGSLIVFSKDDDAGGRGLKRFDCETQQWLTYSITFNMRTGQVATDSTQTNYLDPGATIFYRNRSLYVLSHLPNSDRSQPHEFWRFDFSADGSTVTGPHQLSSPPVYMSLAGYPYPGDHTLVCQLGDDLYAFHSDNMDGDRSTYANTGIVTRIYDGGVYRYSFTSNTWTPSVLPGSESWYRKLRDMGVWNENTGSVGQNWTVTEIPRLGVFLIAMSLESYSFCSFLFKPPITTNEPGMVTGVSAGNVTQTGLALSWAAPANATSYEIEWSDNANFT